jgi:hypothetical protein
MVDPFAMTFVDPPFAWTSRTGRITDVKIKPRRHRWNHSDVTDARSTPGTGHRTTVDGVVRREGAADAAPIPTGRLRERAGIKSAAVAPSIRRMY